MKVILALLAMVVASSAHAQAFRPPASANWGGGSFSDSAPRNIPDLRIPFEGWHADDTPTMWQQRHKRVVAFQAKVANLLRSDGGTLTEDSRKIVEREWTKLRYRNR